MADYWDKAYGPAAAPMEQYWMSIDEAFVSCPSESGSYHALHHVYTPERMQQLSTQLDQAKAAAKDGTENQAYRVDLARRGFRRAGFWRTWYDAINAGDVDKAQATYDEWFAFVRDSQKRGHSNKYATTYLRRFIGGNLSRAVKAAHPQDDGDAKVLAVLPDVWRTATGDQIKAAGKAPEPYAAEYDDSKWAAVKTWSDTRNAQGLPEYFGDMWYRTQFKAPAASGKMVMHFYKADRKVTLYINGEQVNTDEVEAFRGSTLDVTGKLKPGTPNLVAVKIRHIPLPELFLGGLCGPVYLIGHAAE